MGEPIFANKHCRSIDWQFLFLLLIRFGIFLASVWLRAVCGVLCISGAELVCVEVTFVTGE